MVSKPETEEGYIEGLGDREISDISESLSSDIIGHSAVKGQCAGEPEKTIDGLIANRMDCEDSELDIKAEEFRRGLESRNIALQTPWFGDNRGTACHGARKLRVIFSHRGSLRFMATHSNSKGSRLATSSFGSG